MRALVYLRSFSEKAVVGLIGINILICVFEEVPAAGRHEQYPELRISCHDQCAVAQHLAGATVKI